MSLRQQESSPFLKKRTKKLLRPAGRGHPFSRRVCAFIPQGYKSFLVLFFKKGLLALPASHHSA
jgi:hypothetical protein